MCACVQVEVRGQLTGVSSLPPPWGSRGLELRPPGLAGSALTQRALPRAGHLQAPHQRPSAARTRSLAAGEGGGRPARPSRGPADTASPLRYPRPRGAPGGSAPRRLPRRLRKAKFPSRPARGVAGRGGLVRPVTRAGNKSLAPGWR